MKNFILGFLIGSLISGGISYAATKNYILQSEDGIAISDANPLPIEIIY